MQHGAGIVSVLVSALLATAWPAAAQDLAFVEDGPADVADDVVLTLVNDGGTPLRAVRATATVYLDAADASGRIPVPTSLDLGERSGVPGARVVAPGEVVRVVLTTPDDAPRPAAGLVVVTARNRAGETVVARRALEIAEEVAEPATDTWAVVSRAWWWGTNDQGDLGRPIPLGPGTRCPEGEPSYEDRLVSGDRVVVVRLTCRDTGLEVAAGPFPSAGTYTGTLAVGDQDVEVEVRRTLAVWCALIPILLGFVLAIAVQRRMAGSDTQLRWWLGRMRGRAADADRAFLEQASNTDWDRYRIEPAVIRQEAELRRRLRRLRKGLPWWLRWLPWSPSGHEPERSAVVDEIHDLDQLISGWPETHRDLRLAEERLAASPEAGRLAPLLVARLAQVQAPEGELSVDELMSRRDFLHRLDGALAVVDQLAVLDELLPAVDPPDGDEEWSRLDREVLDRARQMVREARAVLLQLPSSGEVQPEIGSLVRRAARLAARLPPTRRDGGMSGATAGGGGVLDPGLVLVRSIVEAVGGRGYAASQSALVLVALLVAVATGLGLLYVGRPWGTLADVLAAFVWGFGATTLLSPALELLRGLADRPGRAVPEPAVE